MKLKEKKNAHVDVSDIASDKQHPETSTGQKTCGGVPTECITSQLHEHHSIVLTQSILHNSVLGWGWNL